jgi:protein-tyrosine-phosphatase
MSDAVDVLFVCQHGAAKSVIAARHLTELAHARGLTLKATAAGVEPDEVIPAHVIAGLRGDGVDDHETAPQPVTRELLASAQIVVSFGCDLSAFAEESGRIVQWNGVPAVSDGYDAARTVILSRLHAILDEAEQRATKERRG